MADKIVLIDGHSILNRAFYGVPDLTNSEGLHTNAVYGFLNIMFKILEEKTPSILVVSFRMSMPLLSDISFMQSIREPESQWQKNCGSRCDVEGDVKGHAHRDYRVCGVGGG